MRWLGFAALVGLFGATPALAQSPIGNPGSFAD